MSDVYQDWQMLDLLQTQTFLEWHLEAMQGTLGPLKE